MAGQQAADHDVAAESGDAPPCGCCGSALYREELGAGRTVCLRCERYIADRLAEVLRLWEKLPKHTEKGSPTGEPGGGSSTGSAAPGDLHVLNLLAGDVPRRLQVHEDAWRRVRGSAPAVLPGSHDRRLRDVLAYLQINLDWACRAGAEVDVRALDGDLRHLLAEMTSIITGERDRRVPVPCPCPMPAPGFPDEDWQAPRCGALLRMYPKEAEIRCAGCKRRVPRHRWHEIGVLGGFITLVQDVA
jgi:hypothetical protein